MRVETDKYISITQATRHFGLPFWYLVKLAEKGEIPSLKINGRRRFNPAKVQEALDRLAEGERQNGK